MKGPRRGFIAEPVARLGGRLAVFAALTGVGAAAWSALEGSPLPRDARGMLCAMAAGMVWILGRGSVRAAKRRIAKLRGGRHVEGKSEGPDVLEGAFGLASAALGAALFLQGGALRFIAGNMERYPEALTAHVLLGKIGVAALAAWTFLAAMRRFSPRVAFFLLFYPALYWVVLVVPAPFPIVFAALNLFLYPGLLLSLALRDVEKGKRGETAAWASALFCFAVVALTGAFATFLPVEYRYARYSTMLRAVHGAMAPAAAMPLLWAAALKWLPDSLKVRRGFKPALFMAAVLSCAAVGNGGRMEGLARLRGAEAGRTHSSRALADKEGREFLRAEGDPLLGSQECGSCHEVEHGEWSVGVHAYAVRNLPFQKTSSALMEKHGEKVGALCATCHEPNLALTDRPDLLIDPAYLPRSEGVGCKSCHYMTEAGEKNGWYAVAFARSDAVEGGPDPRGAFLLNALTEHVRDNRRKPVTEGTQCFPCHRLESLRAGSVKVPVDNVTSFHESVFSGRMTCHRCHMPRLERDRHGYTWMDHRFFGSQRELDRVAIVHYDGEEARLREFSEETERWLAGKLAVARPRDAALDEIRKTFNPAAFRRIDRENAAAFEVAAGGPHFVMELESAESHGGVAELKLSVLNKNISHDYPSSLFANVSETWLELEARDAAGRRVYFSGWNPGDATHRLGRIEIKADGTPIRPEESFEYVDIVNKKYLRPEKKYVEKYSFEVPDDARMPISLEYRLMSRRYADEFVKWFSDGRIDSIPARVTHAQTFPLGLTDAPGKK